MRENYPVILKWAGLSEGGYINHPRDPGAATDRGITQRTFDALSRRQGLPKRSVRGISKETADEILAVEYLQRVVAAKTDGQIGPETMADGPATVT